MAESARVSSIEALDRFRPALIRFMEEASAALMSAEADAGRTAMKLRGQVEPYWKRQMRTRAEELKRAKSELIAKQATKDGDQRSSVDERKAVEKAKRRLAEAERKHELTRTWARRLEKEQDEFRGKIGSLKTVLDRDMPRAIAELDRMILALEDYVRLKPKAAPPLDAPPEEGTP